MAFEGVINMNNIKKKKNSLYIQDNSRKSQTIKKSHHRKLTWKKNLFQFLFKGIEMFWMLLQIIQYLRDIFKK